MAELTDRIRGWIRGPAGASNFKTRQQAARTLLREHIDAGLLDGFIRRSLPPEQHAKVIEHLNRCHNCQEAIAVVLLAHEDPSAAAEIIVESERRAQHRGPWWKIALRWTSFVVGFFAVALLLYLLPKSGDSDSFLGKLFRTDRSEPVQDYSSESNTLTSGWIASTFTNQEDEKPPETGPRNKSGKNTKQVYPGWDTGPAPYHDHVESTPGPVEVEIKPEEPKPATADSAKPESPAATEAAASQAAPATRGRLVVTNSGELMRSLDDGTTWKLITIKHGLAFRALAVSGSTIWAAGDGGALYRSPDAAERWQQVTLQYRNVPLNSNIVYIRFPDPQHGMFKTADGQIWITVDGGNNWVLNYRPQSLQ